jgi:NCAIR mutase (PurE)-related protein
VRRERVKALLDDVAAGRTTIGEALSQLDAAPTESLAFAQIDHHRALRQGFPETIFGEGKTVEQIVAIAGRIAERGDGVLITRASAEARAAIRAQYPVAELNEMARTALVRGENQSPLTTKTTLIVTAGTSDLPVAEEAAVTLGAFGAPVMRLTDVGVAGIHRLLSQQDALRDAAVIIVVAGMDGALPSVVGGLVRVPVIAVPTSVGYGASFNGLAPLLTMLNSCAAGVTVCNIDNGFGAAMAAARILID